MRAAYPSLQPRLSQLIHGSSSSASCVSAITAGPGLFYHCRSISASAKFLLCRLQTIDQYSPSFHTTPTRVENLLHLSVARTTIEN